MHNPEHLANPLDPLAQELKKLTGKTRKTVDDHKAIARLEFEGSLYYVEGTGVVVPSWNIKKCFIEGARLRKNGKNIERGFVPLSKAAPLVYDGPTSPDDLWEQGFWRVETMGQRGSRITRTRPFFAEWSIGFEASLDTNLLNPSAFDQVLEDAGALIGIGDSRNMGYGRFNASYKVLEGEVAA